MSEIPELKNDVTNSGEAVRYKVHWYRSTIFQILVVGGVFFCVCCTPLVSKLAVEKF